jgi:hypothetical protein
MACYERVNKYVVFIICGISFLDELRGQLGLLMACCERGNKCMVFIKGGGFDELIG